MSDLTRELQFGCYGYVVEIDIKGFFDHVDHDWLLRMLEERIDDRPFLRLIGKWLKAGVLEEDGQVIHPQTGTPQGGCISPILANIYLHYVLDLWFARKVKPRCRLRAFMCRYLDDVVFAFQRRDEAQAFYRACRPGWRSSAWSWPQRSPASSASAVFIGRQGPELRVPGVRVSLDSGPTRDTAGHTPDIAQAVPGVAGPGDQVDSRGAPSPRGLDFARLNRKLLGYYNYYGVRGNCRSLGPSSIRS